MKIIDPSAPFKIEIEKVVLDLYGGPGRVVTVEYISLNRSFEAKVEMPDGIVYGPHVESKMRLDDDKKAGNSHLLKERLLVGPLSDIPSDNT